MVVDTDKEKLYNLSDLSCLERFVWLLYGTRNAISLEDRYITEGDLQILNENLEYLDKLGMEYLGYDAGGGAGYVFQRKGWNEELKKTHPDGGDVKTAGLFYGYPECCSQKFKEYCSQLEEEYKDDCPMAHIGFRVYKKLDVKSFIDGEKKEYLYLLLLDCIPCKVDCNEFEMISKGMYDNLVDFDGEAFADDVVKKYKKRVRTFIHGWLMDRRLIKVNK